MTKQVLGKAAVPLSPVVGAGDFVSGRTPVGPNGETAGGLIEHQTRPLTAEIDAIASRSLPAKT